MDYFRDLPTPLTFTLTAFQDPDDVSEENDDARVFSASCLQSPGEETHSTDAVTAVENLFRVVLRSQPLAPDVVDALRHAGYDDDIIRAWDESTRGGDLRYRNDPQRAVEFVGRYIAAGVPLERVCEFFGVLEPAEAAAVHAAGGCRDEVLAYHAMGGRRVGGSIDELPWLVARFPSVRAKLYIYQCSLAEAVEWEAVAERCHLSDDDISNVLALGLEPADIATGFPGRRAAFYNECNTSAQTARRWERALRSHTVDDADLRDVLRVGFDPECLRHAAVTGGNAGRRLGDVARMLMAQDARTDAIRRAESSRLADPWQRPS